MIFLYHLFLGRVFCGADSFVTVSPFLRFVDEFKDPLREVWGLLDG